MAETVSEDGETEKQFLSLFDTGLSPLFIADMPEPSAIEKNLKKKYAENPLYSLLLRIDIDSFLARQPASHLLSLLEERTLFQKRQILGHYYDTLRHYNQLQNWDEFQTIYNGSKSFANRVYNQQFKGTLKVVRRLFSITLDRDQGEDERRILKFDQPLFEQERGGSLATAGRASVHLVHPAHPLHPFGMHRMHRMQGMQRMQKEVRVKLSIFMRSFSHLQGEIAKNLHSLKG